MPDRAFSAALPPSLLTQREDPVAVLHLKRPTKRSELGDATIPSQSQYLLDDSPVVGRAMELAARVADNAPQTNHAIVEAPPRVAEASRHEGYLVEVTMATITQSTDDAKNRMRAFLNGRAQKITDR